MTAVEIDGIKIALAGVQGAVYAFHDACTHLQCSLSTGELEGASVVCPCHLGRFDLATGAVLDGPPPAPLRTLLARVVHGQVEVAP